MTIGELDKRVTVLNYTSAQDGTTGKITSSLTSSWDKWMKVEMNSGNRVLDQAAINYRETYTFWDRYETSRPTLQKYHLGFDNKDLTIHSVTKQKIGKLWWEQIIAYTTV